MKQNLVIPFDYDENDPRNKQVKTIGERFARFFHALSADDVAKYQNGKIFQFPFFIDEECFDKLNKEIIENFSLIHNITPYFTSSTRFQDLTSVKFNSFEDFIQKAGNKKDPESAELSWNIFDLDISGEPIAGIVQISIVTEKRLNTSITGIGDYHHPWIELNISGSSLDWVEKTFSNIEPYINTFKLGGIYRPLWIFRNKWVITFLAHTLSWIGFFLGIKCASHIFNKEGYLSRIEVLNKILNETNIAEKFDIYVTQILTPKSSPWWEPIIIFGFGMISLVFIYYIGMTALPNLAPKSSIAIGLSNKRAINSLNVFKFIIFSLMLSGILFPLCFELIKRFL